jgi:tetratricopeptide (TPR) repeat protein
MADSSGYLLRVYLVFFCSMVSMSFLRRSQLSKQSRWQCLWTTVPLASMLWSSVVLAADPFRTGANARPMSATLESAFEDFFRHGNYLNSGQKLTVAQAENPKEPLVYTLQAALAYLNEQPEQMKALAQTTRKVSEGMQAKDAARSHLYRGISQGLEGTSYYLKDNGVAGVAMAFTFVPPMLLEIDKARQMAPDDPEVNLIVGYVNTVLKKYDDALTSFQKAGPSYLAYRGQALIYRDKKDYPQAQTMVEKAITAAPQNPELLYLKAQILASRQQPLEAVTFFDKALSLGKQLPESTKKQIRKERSKQVAKLTLPAPVPNL